MKIAFMGTPYFVVPTLAALAAGHDVIAVYTKAPKPKGRKREIAKSPAHEFADTHNIPVFAPASFRKQPEEVEKLRALAPDMIVVFAYGLILPQSVLDIAPCVCVHPSLLPLYRGMNPMQRAILNGDPKTGISLIAMDTGMDTGDMLMVEEIPIPPDMTLGGLETEIGAKAAPLVLRYMENKDSIALRPQPEGATLAGPLANGEEKIDWNRTALQIHNLIRACVPAPKAYFTHNGNIIKVLKSKPVAPPAKGAPGAILDAGLAVACKNGTALRLLEIQRSGAKPMPARDFLNGYRLKPGDRLE